MDWSGRRVPAEFRVPGGPEEAPRGLPEFDFRPVFLGLFYR
jgi:hypothetical protein